MFTDTTLIIINATCIAFLLTMLITLAAATRMKGGAGWAALIIVTTTIPVYLSNLTRIFEAENYLPYLYLAIFLNTICLPALWFFTRSQFDKTVRFTARNLIHTIPAFVSLFVYIAYYATIPAEQTETERAFIINLPELVNTLIVFGQFIGYYLFIFLYIRKKNKFLQDNYSDSGYLETRWTPRFLILSCILFFVVFAVYATNPRIGVWVIPILNSIVMAYLVYCVISHSTTAYINRLPDVPTVPEVPTAPSPVERAGGEVERMKEICHTITHYLETSQAYKNSDFSLAALSLQTGIHHNNISAAINGYLQKNFFELINAMRVEEAKRLLLNLNADHTIESIFAECGFRSRSTFFTTFKKIEGKTPTQWLKTF
jgi:AraC-like DNA-binding protein